jgi:flavin-dependent dehydrogenase
MQEHFDVVIVGGGPGGSTLGGLIKKYRPTWSVLILEKEKFPREHIGESQLPHIGPVLYELGVWDKVEAANFPVKIGATFRWGKEPELWDFNFIPPSDYLGLKRPAPFEGVRRMTAFQVDRAIYDDILLRHAESLGCVVREQTWVRTQDVAKDGDSIAALKLNTGATVTGRWYVDASGEAGVLRKAMGVEIDCPTELKNVAFWDYWENTAWADTIGVGGTRIQVMSVDFGWLWFIPLGPTRTSLGLVCPAAYYRDAGKSPEELYEIALAASERIRELVKGGTRSGEVRARKDWSYIANRQSGENWFLVGEAAGFADPILSAGLTLTHIGARELAYTLFALEDGSHEAKWLIENYGENQRRRVRQHMRFAEFWYAANGQFTDLKEYCQTIARESGLAMTPKQAWAWLAQGGFANDSVGQAGIGGYSLSAMNQVTQRFLDEDLAWHANDRNVFKLNLAGAQLQRLAHYEQGQIKPVDCYVREGKRLPVIGLYALLIECLKRSSEIQPILQLLATTIQRQFHVAEQQAWLLHCMQVLEVMVAEGWVEAGLDPSLPRLGLASPRIGELIRPHVDLSQSGTRV